MLMIPIFILLFINLYYYGFPLFYKFAQNTTTLNSLMLKFRSAGFFVTPLKTKLWISGLILASSLMRTGGTSTTVTLKESLIIFFSGMVLFLCCPAKWTILYCLTTMSGAGMFLIGGILLAKQMKHKLDITNDAKESWLHCEKLIENEYSVNIPIKYQFQHKQRKGWINVIAPQRATMVLGVPGSGKSFAVYNPFIEQMIAKEYTMFVYDYKFPDLTNKVYNELLYNLPHIKQKPRFCLLNFKDVRFSQRCNPISPEYIEGPSDTSEIAEIIMKNIKKGDDKDGDFFNMSAKEYLDTLIYFLRIYKDGKYCTFPHAVELMGQDYEKVFDILETYTELETKMAPFIDANKKGAQQQLQGQIASARIPMNKFSDPYLYWVLSENDFTLDINNPDDPKILCVGNDPDRQMIYGTTLALFTSRMFKLINHQGKKKSAVLLDELPTIFVKGLDQLIATARSNKVAIVMGAQDRAQLTRDYDKKEADVIFGTTANLFAGQVKQDTAKDLANSFGQEKREKTSITYGENNESSQVSENKEDLISRSTLETLSQGYFVGVVADTFDQKIEEKRFYGEIQIDMKLNEEKSKNAKKIPQLTFFDEELIRTTYLEGDQKILDPERRKLSAEAKQDEIITKYFVEKEKIEVIKMKDDLEKREYKARNGAFGRDEQELRVIEEEKAKIANYEKTINRIAVEKTRELRNKENLNEFNELLNELIEKKCNEYRDLMVQNNYRKIKEDVANIVKEESARILERKVEQQRMNIKRQNEEKAKKNIDDLNNIKQSADNIPNVNIETSDDFRAMFNPTNKDK